ncbi:hypothetical protein [Spiroplasma endosymbiont of Megaselia nigra]|uniref:hypothetical protein n=1 Tax=Spiroplasma endosymbiont of Megaselia nigra TaxID=2478537 RepID=UPI000F8617A4|nr:hypothetical protein [Spiroplasma endosymbiont of Megaselia nigra]RUO85933.1 hypothetical protein D9R21_05985 [Spiroplasma endosymbiont of Megaselia nigra]
MKKLLSLLSVLTISGTAVPTTIAASPYKKQEINLENLNRNKRNTELKDNRLWKDFNYDLDKDKISLGLIDDTDYGQNFDLGTGVDIPEWRIKVGVELAKRYSVFNGYKSSAIGISEIKIFNSFCYYFTIYIKGNQNWYTEGLRPKTKFIFSSKTRINETNNIISKNNNINQWINHANQFKVNFNRQLNENYNNKNYQDKKEWIENKLEIINSYLRDWNYIENLIEHDIKLQELNYVIEGISKDINNLKLEISKINNKINSIQISSISENSNYDSKKPVFEACAATTGLIAAGSALIPVIGTLASALFGIYSASCSIGALIVS